MSSWVKLLTLLASFIEKALKGYTKAKNQEVYDEIERNPVDVFKSKFNRVSKPE